MEMEIFSVSLRFPATRCEITDKGLKWMCRNSSKYKIVLWISYTRIQKMGAMTLMLEISMNRKDNPPTPFLFKARFIFSSVQVVILSVIIQGSNFGMSVHLFTSEWPCCCISINVFIRLIFLFIINCSAHL